MLKYTWYSFEFDISETLLDNFKLSYADILRYLF